LLGVRQKNGSPGHPQTQGKIERFHQTLQRWLRARPLVTSSAHLQRQLDEFREHYNEHRSHRALDRRTPGEAYRATPKAAPAGARPTALPAALRPPRPQRQDEPPPRRKDAPPRHRRRARTQTRPGLQRRHPRHRRKTSRPARSSQSISSSQKRPTGATKQRARPMAGPFELRPMTRLIRDTCPDSSHNGARGTRTPDLLGAMQEVCAAEVAVLQGLPWCSGGGVLAWIAGDYRQFWGFQALGDPSA
jgi:transposase InsO family protein